VSVPSTAGHIRVTASSNGLRYAPVNGSEHTLVLAFDLMTDALNTTNSRTDTDQPTPESSPSAGWRETAALMHVTAGLEEVDGDTDDVRREDVRCIDHEKDIMEEST